MGIKHSTTDERMITLQEKRVEIADSNIIDLAARVEAIEERLRSERLTSRSIIPLVKVALAELNGDGEMGQATIELLELVKVIAMYTHQPYNAALILEDFIWRCDDISQI